MTKEELKQQFYKYIKDHEDYFDPREPWTERIILQIWFDCAEPREKQIHIDAEQIRALQKQNGELTDKVNDLEEKLANADYQLEGRDNEIRELEAQIEKMKNCKNCKKLKKEKDGLLVCTVGSFYTNRFGENCDKWEIKEK